MWSIPLLRHGVVYHSLDTQAVHDCQSGEVIAEVSQANPAMISKDLGASRDARRRLAELSTPRLIEIMADAGRIFLNEEVNVDGEPQSAEEYRRLLSQTTGLPHSLCRANMEKIHSACTQMKTILAGFTRGVDLAVLERGMLNAPGEPLSYRPRAFSLGVILPSNSPGVNTLWLPAIPLRTPVMIKPGREDPWTPLRLILALIQAGCPPEIFGYYPSAHEGAVRILEDCGRSLLFGSDETTSPWKSHTGVQIHTQGRSKILIDSPSGVDQETCLEVCARSMLDNSGRSCINASTIILASEARAFGEALASRLAGIVPLPPEDPGAALAAFPNPPMAEHIDAHIQQVLGAGSAVDLTERLRAGPRFTQFMGATYLRPTVLFCEDLRAPLATTEYPFPFVAVVEMPLQQALDMLGPSLTVTVMSTDSDLIRQALLSPEIDHINLGPIPTSTIRWDQPHEGNLFDLLYTRRAIQVADKS
jgi:acyl-CoA reductase-like NAD-dependent aldehyde dehydrogenase